MQTERLDYLQYEKTFHGCRILGCPNEAKNYYKGVKYCPLHVMEIRDGKLNFDQIFESRKTDVFLYVLEAPEVNLLKFGQSTNPEKRHRQVRDGSPVDVELLGYCLDPAKGKLEAWVHAYLYQHRTKGGWFRDHSETRGMADLITGNQPWEIVALARIGNQLKVTG